MKPSIGRIVQVRIGGTEEEPELRPALVVKVWGDTCINVQTFLDGTNDKQHIASAKDSAVSFGEVDCLRGHLWATSVCEGVGIGQWRWPAKV